VQYYSQELAGDLHVQFDSTSKVICKEVIGDLHVQFDLSSKVMCNITAKNWLEICTFNLIYHQKLCAILQPRTGWRFALSI